MWRAYDVVEHLEVAVKMHQLNPHWSDAKKTNYTKHATREYNIHRSLSHPRIVRLLDVFEIDINAFATVLEYCRGTDLDRKLKETSLLAEKEARSILVQVISGLCYLNGRGREKEAVNGVRRIIHYDLKVRAVVVTVVVAVVVVVAVAVAVAVVVAVVVVVVVVAVVVAVVVVVVVVVGHRSPPPGVVVSVQHGGGGGGGAGVGRMALEEEK